jgi:hypothetical protein
MVVLVPSLRWVNTCANVLHVLHARSLRTIMRLAHNSYIKRCNYWHFCVQFGWEVCSKWCALHPVKGQGRGTVTASLLCVVATYVFRSSDQSEAGFITLSHCRGRLRRPSTLFLPLSPHFRAPEASCKSKLQLSWHSVVRSG